MTDRISRAQAVLAAAATRGIGVCALGGVAVQLTCASARVGGPLHRELADVDLATTTKARRQVEAVIEGTGFVADEGFNRMNGSTRLRYFDSDGSHLDVFIDELRLCHTITWKGGLQVGVDILPLPELLLTKLQVVQQEAKDRSDLSALLTDRWRELTDAMARLAELVRGDWGLWRTGSISLQSLIDDSDDVVRQRAADLHERWLAFPLTAKARLRAGVGDRVRWYQQPEEV